MPADPRRLIELGMVPELAREVARMIGQESPQLADHEERISALEDAMQAAIVTDDAT